MSHVGAVALAIVCVCLTALAQILLKMGMSSTGMQQAMDGQLKSIYWLALVNPLIWGGMLCFGASAVLWLIVLGKLEVSAAYPLTSLGIVLTTVSGMLLLGETVSLNKLLGVTLVVAGVLLLSIKN